MSLLFAAAGLTLFDIVVALLGHDSRDGRDWSETPPPRSREANHW
jgi:hypothetical protein